MDQKGSSEDLRTDVELVRSSSEKQLLRPSARYYSVFKGQATDTDPEKGRYALIKDAEDFPSGIYEKQLPCFGCGIGWFSFLLGFAFPLMWYYATVLYFGNYYRKDPRERAGLAASAICVILFLYVGLYILTSWRNYRNYAIGLQALVCSVVLVVIVLFLLF